MGVWVSAPTDPKDTTIADGSGNAASESNRVNGAVTTAAKPIGGTIESRIPRSHSISGAAMLGTGSGPGSDTSTPLVVSAPRSRRDSNAGGTGVSTAPSANDPSQSHTPCDNTSSDAFTSPIDGAAQSSSCASSDGSVRCFGFQRTIPSELDVPSIFELLLSVHNRTGLLREFTLGEIQLLAQVLTALKFKAGESVIEPGEPSSFVGIILSGKLEVVLSSEGSVSNLYDPAVATLEPGNLLGEISCFEGGTRTALVRSAITVNNNTTNDTNEGKQDESSSSSNNEESVIALITFSELESLKAIIPDIRLKLMYLFALEGLKKLRKGVQMQKDKEKEKEKEPENNETQSHSSTMDASTEKHATHVAVSGQSVQSAPLASTSSGQSLDNATVPSTESSNGSTSHHSDPTDGDAHPSSSPLSPPDRAIGTIPEDFPGPPTTTSANGKITDGKNQQLVMGATSNSSIVASEEKKTNDQQQQQNPKKQLRKMPSNTSMPSSRSESPVQTAATSSSNNPNPAPSSSTSSKPHRRGLSRRSTMHSFGSLNALGGGSGSSNNNSKDGTNMAREKRPSVTGAATVTVSGSSSAIPTASASITPRRMEAMFRNRGVTSDVAVSMEPEMKKQPNSTAATAPSSAAAAAANKRRLANVQLVVSAQERQLMLRAQQIDCLTRDLQKVSESRREAQTNAAQLSKLIRQRDNEKAALSNALADANQKVSTLQKTVSVLEAQMAGDINDASHRMAEELTKAHTAADKERRRCMEMERELKNVRESLNSIQVDANSREKQSSRAISKLERERCDLAQNKLLLESEISALRSRNKDLASQLSSLTQTQRGNERLLEDLSVAQSQSHQLFLRTSDRLSSTTRELNQWKKLLKWALVSIFVRSEQKKKRLRQMEAEMEEIHRMIYEEICRNDPSGIEGKEQKELLTAAATSMDVALATPPPPRKSSRLGNSVEQYSFPVTQTGSIQQPGSATEHDTSSATSSSASTSAPASSSSSAALEHPSPYIHSLQLSQSRRPLTRASFSQPRGSVSNERSASGGLGSLDEVLFSTMDRFSRLRPWILHLVTIKNQWKEMSEGFFRRTIELRQQVGELKEAIGKERTKNSSMSKKITELESTLRELQTTQNLFSPEPKSGHGTRSRNGSRSQLHSTRSSRHNSLCSINSDISPNPNLISPPSSSRASWSHSLAHPATQGRLRIRADSTSSNEGNEGQPSGRGTGIQRPPPLPPPPHTTTAIDMRNAHRNQLRRNSVPHPCASARGVGSSPFHTHSHPTTSISVVSPLDEGEEDAAAPLQNKCQTFNGPADTSDGSDSNASDHNDVGAATVTVIVTQRSSSDSNRSEHILSPPPSEKVCSGNHFIHPAPPTISPSTTSPMSLRKQRHNLRANDFKPATSLSPLPSSCKSAATSPCPLFLPATLGTVSSSASSSLPGILFRSARAHDGYNRPRSLARRCSDHAAKSSKVADGSLTARSATSSSSNPTTEAIYSQPAKVLASGQACVHGHGSGGRSRPRSRRRSMRKVSPRPVLTIIGPTDACSSTTRPSSSTTSAPTHTQSQPPPPLSPHLPSIVTPRSSTSPPIPAPNSASSTRRLGEDANKREVAAIPLKVPLQMSGDDDHDDYSHTGIGNDILSNNQAIKQLSPDRDKPTLPATARTTARPAPDESASDDPLHVTDFEHEPVSTVVSRRDHLLIQNRDGHSQMAIAY